MNTVKDILQKAPPRKPFFDSAQYNQPMRPDRVKLDSLDASVHPKVDLAIKAARQWWALRKEQKSNRELVTASLLLVATPQNDIVTGKGAGKSHIAKACLWTDFLAVNGKPVSPSGRFFSAEWLIEIMHNERKRFSDFTQVEAGSIVVIDDIGTEKKLEYVSAADQEEQINNLYFQIFEYAINAGISIIATSNLSIDGVAKRIGQRAFSRFMQMAPQGLMVDMTGVPDYRRKDSGR